MVMPGFTAADSLYQTNTYYLSDNGSGAPSNGSPKIVPAQSRCPVGCYEANVACTGFLLWNTCWCRDNGRTCPTGGWWVGGVCFGGWTLGCIGTPAF